MTLEIAIEIAAKAHAGQKDKGGQDYILHPLRVMMRMETNEQRIVAVLHDVLEDTHITEADLRREGFSEEIIAALKCLTRIEAPSPLLRPGQGKEIYLTEFIPRIAKNPLARAVKLADLADNMDPNRVPPGQEGGLHESQLRKYAKAKVYIEKQIELENAEKLCKKLREELGQ